MMNNINQLEETPRFSFWCVISLTLIAIITLLALPVMASDTSDAQYYGTITISNNGSAATIVSVNLTLATQELIDNGYIVSSCNNTSIITNGGGDAPYMPAQGSGTQWIIFVPSIGASSSLDYRLYTGGVSMNSTLAYFPDLAGMTTSDAAGIELGDNFSVSLNGYFNTSENHSYILKDSAFRIGNDGTTLFATITGNWTTPTGFTDPDTAWLQEANSYDDNTGTNAGDGGVPGQAWSSFLQLEHSALSIESVRLWAVMNNGNDGTDQIDVDVYYSTAWHHVYNGAFTEGAWVTYELSSPQTVTEMRVRFWNDDAAGADTAELYEADFGEAVSVNYSSFASGEQIITAAANTANLTLSTDGTERDSISLAGYSVVDNANNYVTANMTYLLYQRIYVDGVLQQDIAWENDTTFSDLSGNSNDATPTFRTGTTHASVNATLMTFEPVSPAISDNWTILADPVASTTGNLTDIPELYTENTTAHIPGAGIFNFVMTDVGFPHMLFWFLAPLLVIVVVGHFLNRSLLGQYLFLFGAAITLAMIGPWPAWISIVYAIDGMAIVLASRSFGN